VYSVAFDCQRGRRLCEPSDKLECITPIRNFAFVKKDYLQASDGGPRHEVLLCRFKDEDDNLYSGAGLWLTNFHNTCRD
jgi:hypothetical protein